MSKVRKTIPEVRLTPPSTMDPCLLSAVLYLKQRSSLSQRSSNSPAFAMAPTKEPDGLDNLAFDVSAMTYLNKHSYNIFGYFYMIVLHCACKKQTTSRKDSIPSVWNCAILLYGSSADGRGNKRRAGRKEGPAT